MMCLDKILPHFLPLDFSPIPQELLSLKLQVVFFLNPLSSFSPTHMCVGVEQSSRSWVDISVVSLKQTNFLSPTSHLLPIVPWWEGDRVTGVYPEFTWLAGSSLLNIVTVVGSSCVLHFVKSNEYYFSADIHFLQHLYFFLLTSFSMISEPWVRGIL